MLFATINGKLWYFGKEQTRRVYRAHDGSLWIYWQGRKECVRGPRITSQGFSAAVRITD